MKINKVENNLLIQNNIFRLTNQIYKLLPEREEGLNWILPLNTIIVEVRGMFEILEDYKGILFQLLCKLEGLSTLVKEEDYFTYRRTIFECLSLCSKFKKHLLYVEESE